MKDKRLSTDDVDVVLPVGGSSYIPRVKEQLRAIFPKAKIPESDTFDPELAVVHGAALCAEYLEKDPKALPMDVTPLSLGVAEMKAGDVSRRVKGGEGGVSHAADGVVSMRIISEYQILGRDADTMKVGVEISPLSTGSISQASVVNDVFLLLDVSGSMKGEKFNALKLSTKKIVQSLPAFTRLYMCAYGSPGCVAEFDLTSINEDDRQRAMKFIDGLSLAGFTNMGSALRTVIQIVKNRSDNNPATVTALTDGKPDSKPECITAVNQAMDDLGKKVPLSFHTIGFGLADSEGELDGAFLHKMAELGRGRYYYAAGLNLEDVMGEILRDSVNVQAQQVP